MRLGFFQRDVDQATGGEAEPLGDQVQIIVVNPDCREVIGHAQGHGVLSGFEADHWLEPHLKNVFRKEFLEVAFYGFPQAG